MSFIWSFDYTKACTEIMELGNIFLIIQNLCINEFILDSAEQSGAWRASSRGQNDLKHFCSSHHSQLKSRLLAWQPTGRVERTWVRVWEKGVCVCVVCLERGLGRTWDEAADRQVEYKHTRQGKDIWQVQVRASIIHTYTYRDRETHIQRQAAGPFVVHRDLLYYPAVTCPVGCMWPPAPTQQRVKWAEQPRLQGCRETRETQPSLPFSLPPSILPSSLYLLFRYPHIHTFTAYHLHHHATYFYTHLLCTGKTTCKVHRSGERAYERLLHNQPTSALCVFNGI